MCAFMCKSEKTIQLDWGSLIFPVSFRIGLFRSPICFSIYFFYVMHIFVHIISCPLMEINSMSIEGWNSCPKIVFFHVFHFYL